MLRSDLCDFSEVYIVVTGKITVASADNDAYDKNVAFKNNAPFTSYISKINNTRIDNAEDLDIAMPMYNLIKYSKNYRKTTGSLWNYYRDEPNNGLGGDDNNENCSIKDSESFDYKKSIRGKLEDGNAEKDNVKIAVPLRHLSNFWITLDMSLLNCEVSLALTWSEKCALTSKAPRDGSDSSLVLAANNPTNVTFKITDIKLYFPVVTLSTENDSKLSEQLKAGFKRIIKWNKYRSKMSNQAANNNLNYLIDPTFINVNRSFVLSFTNDDDRSSFSSYNIPKLK